MNRYALLAACSLALVAASACDDESKPALTTSTSSGVGGTASGGGTGGASSGSGGASSGSGGTSSGSGGTSSGAGGSSSSSGGVGGSEGECTTCAEYFTECFANGCPSKTTLCVASIQIWDAAFSCFCQQCFNDCEHTCSGSSQDQSGCPSCMQTAMSGTCSAQMATCNADTD